MNAIIALLPVALEGIKGAVSIFNTLREQARRTGELSAAEDAEYERKLNDMFARDYWQPRTTDNQPK